MDAVRRWRTYETPTSNNQKTEEISARMSAYKQRLRHLQQAWAASCLHPCHLQHGGLTFSENPIYYRERLHSVHSVLPFCSCVFWSLFPPLPCGSGPAPCVLSLLLCFLHKRFYRRSFPLRLLFDFFSFPFQHDFRVGFPPRYLCFTSCIDRLISFEICFHSLEVHSCVLWVVQNAYTVLFNSLACYSKWLLHCHHYYGTSGLWRMHVVLVYHVSASALGPAHFELVIFWIFIFKIRVIFFFLQWWYLQYWVEN